MKLGMNSPRGHYKVAAARTTEQMMRTETLARGTLTTQTRVEGTTMPISEQPRCAASAVAEAALLPYQTKKLASTRTEAVETVEVTIVLGTMKAIQTNAEITTIQISTQILIAALAVAESMELTQLLQTEVIVAGAKTPTTELEMLGTTPANGTPQTSAHVEITMMMISLQVPCVATVMAEALEVAGTPETLKAP